MTTCNYHRIAPTSSPDNSMTERGVLRNKMPLRAASCCLPRRSNHRFSGNKNSIKRSIGHEARASIAFPKLSRIEAPVPRTTRPAMSSPKIKPRYLFHTTGRDKMEWLGTTSPADTSFVTVTPTAKKPPFPEEPYPLQERITEATTVSNTRLIVGTSLLARRNHTDHPARTIEKQAMPIRANQPMLKLKLKPRFRAPSTPPSLLINKENDPASKQLPYLFLR